ncbi:hypothetical protein AB0L56_31125 [Streptomyces sp. NPDC052079]|uniref:hypothetical protein n=1 Tax=Streptomyces sp. NPDC052079 TaxID=3155526 RepID=UPI00341497DF
MDAGFGGEGGRGHAGVTDGGLAGEEPVHGVTDADPFILVVLLWQLLREEAGLEVDLVGFFPHF